MARVAFGIGSNLGDRLANLQLAVDALAAAPGVTVLAVSPLYETDPVGGPEQPDFLNAVVLVESALAPRALLELGQSIEREAGREREVRWGPRTLDVDIVVIEGVTVREPDLEVPHPRAHERGFVLEPLMAVAPDLARALTDRTAGFDWPGVRSSPLQLRQPF